MDWMVIARELQAIGQAGLHFSKDRFDTERYQRINRLAAEILSAHSNLPVEVVLAWNAREFGYPTPKVDVRAVVFQQGKVLLIREDADEGRWALPGGWADVNESPTEAVMRELQEETGFAGRAMGLLAVLDREKQRHEPPFPYHVYKLFFRCEITGGSPTPNPESSAVSFFDTHNLPQLSVSRVTKEQIRRFARKIQEGDRTTDFD
ncbi:MAG: NUDIX hydrolase [Verrucomicrobiia bacterium]|jgi:ADP-ribose pyrophosphatase YjhB (NUDIX family)